MDQDKKHPIFFLKLSSCVYENIKIQSHAANEINRVVGGGVIAAYIVICCLILALLLPHNILFLYFSTVGVKISKDYLTARKPKYQAVLNICQQKIVVAFSNLITKAFSTAQACRSYNMQILYAITVIIGKLVKVRHARLCLRYAIQ